MYSPRQIPVDPELLGPFLAEELRNISEAMQSMEGSSVLFHIEHNGVAKPRAGLLVTAAAGVLGTSEGVYRYNSTGSWVFVG